MRYESPGTLQTLMDIQLGDVVTLGTGQSLSVRAAERQLAVPVGTMNGFVLAGEIGPQSVLLSVPCSHGEPVGVYTPLDHIPAHARSARAVCQGVVSYWAPHLPNLSGAQGELGYKVAAVRGSVDPVVLLWRGEERVVFVRSGTFSIESLRFTSLPRDASATEVDQLRYASTVHRGVAGPADLPAERSVERAGPRRRFW